MTSLAAPTDAANRSRMSARVGNQLELRKMAINKIVLGVCCALVLGMSACSRQQSDWQKTRETNTAEAYEQFLKKYPSGEFAPQAQARVKELYEERDWQKARDADTPEAYQAFLKQYPEGKWTEEARIRVENFTLAQTPSGTGTAPGRRPAPSRRGEPRRAVRATARLPRPAAVLRKIRALPPAKSPGHAAAGHAPKQNASAAVKSGELWCSTRRLQIGSGRRQPALGSSAEGISAAPGGHVLEGGAQEDGERHALPAAGVRCDGKPRA